MVPWPHIPDDAVTWFRNAFAGANQQVTHRLTNVPNIRETSLDDGLIEALIPDSAPLLLPSGAIVRMDTHNIGGLRRMGGSWETADIAVLVFVYRGENLIARKIGLLQSKRLYPASNDVEDEDEVGFRYGMNAFLGKESKQAIGALRKEFVFKGDCLYGALLAGDKQVAAIDGLNAKFGQVAYYLFYNPDVLPLSVSYPVHNRLKVGTPELGCRVYDAASVHAALATLATNSAPTYDAISAVGKNSNWRLEVWAADLLLRCKVGQQFDATRDAEVRNLLQRRSGPIGAAIAVSITLP